MQHLSYHLVRTLAVFSAAIMVVSALVLGRVDYSGMSVHAHLDQVMFTT